MDEKIINEIKLNLGENKDLNKKYLSSQMEKYKDHEFNVEILRELSRMMWDCLSDEEKQEFINTNVSEMNLTDKEIAKTYLDHEIKVTYVDRTLSEKIIDMDFGKKMQETRETTKRTEVER